MFVTQNTTVLGGRGFSVGGSQGYLKYASGYPLTLTKTLAKPMESITIYGNTVDGKGVGERTSNLCSNMDIAYSTYNNYNISNGTLIVLGSTLMGFICKVNSNTRYTYAFYNNTQFSSMPQMRVREYADIPTNWSDNFVIQSVNMNFNNSIGTKIVSFTTSGETSYVIVGIYASNSLFLNRFQLVEGEYTAESLPEFEPYGYKIPILINPPVLPSGYTKLEYIATASSESLNAYIDTGVYANPNLRVNAEVEFIEVKANASIFRSGVNFWAGVYVTGDKRWGYTYKDDSGNFTALSNFSAPQTGIRYTIDFDGKQKILKINNSSITIQRSPATKTCSKTLPLLGGIGGDGVSVYSDFYGKLYNCMIYDNDVLVRNFIPAKRNSDGVVGMYDTVNGVFYTNAGTGSFIAGAEIPNKTINLYSDAALNEGDYLTVDPKHKTATRGENTGTDTWTTTDVSSLQDFEQDWKIPKAEELTVSADTEVEPSSMEIAYYSSIKG